MFNIEYVKLNAQKLFNYNYMYTYWTRIILKNRFLIFI